MLNEHEIEKLIIELKKGNFDYFLNAYTFDQRKKIVFDIFSNEQKENTNSDTIVNALDNFDDEVSIKFVSKLFSNSEAEMLYENLDNYDSIIQNIIIMCLNEERKYKVLDMLPVSFDAEFVIESIDDINKKKYYKDKFDINNFINNASEEEKKEFVNNASSFYNREKVVKTISDEQFKYNFIMNNKLFGDSLYNIFETINDKKILLDILKIEGVMSSYNFERYLVRIPNEDRKDIIISYLSKGYSLYAITKIIKELPDTIINEIFISNDIDYDKIGYYSIYNLFEELPITFNMKECLKKLIISRIINVNNFFDKNKPDDLIYYFIKDEDNILNNENKIHLFKILKDDSYKKASLEYVRAFIGDIVILNSLNDDQSKIDFLDSLAVDQINAIFNSDNIIAFNDDVLFISYLYDSKYSSEISTYYKINYILKLSSKDKIDVLEKYNTYLNKGELTSIILSLDNENKILCLEKYYSELANSVSNIIMTLDDNNKFKALQLYKEKILTIDFVNILCTIRDSKYDSYKIELLKQLLKDNGESNNYNYFISSTLSSIVDQDFLFNVFFDKDIVSTNTIKCDFLTRYLAVNKKYDSLRKEFIYEFIKSDDALDNNANSILISLLNTIESKDIVIDIMNDSSLNISDDVKISVYSFFNEDKYDSVIREFIINCECTKLSDVPKVFKKFNDIIIDEIFLKISNKKKLEYLCVLNDFKYDKYKTSFLNNILVEEQNNNIFYLINTITDENKKLEFLIKFNNFDQINTYILHNDFILQKTEIIESLLDIYVEKFSLNKDHLSELINNFGYGVLRFVNNNNIQNIINSKDIDFKKLMKLFNIQDCILVEDKHIDSVLFCLLQKDFVINEVSTLTVFNDIKELIENNDTEKAIKKIRTVVEFLQKTSSDYINTILKKYNYNEADELYSSIINNKDVSLDIINQLTNKYILEKRNDHANRNYKKFKDSLHLEKTYEKNGLIKKFINISAIEKIIEQLNTLDKNILNNDELELLDNREILIECINLKKGVPISLEKELIVKHIKVFNGLLDKLYYDKRINYVGADDIKAIYNIRKNNASIINILSEININMLTDKLFANNELFASLESFLKTNRMIGWGNVFNNLANKVDMDLDESTISAFFNYFYIIFDKLIQKNEHKSEGLDKRKITLSEYLNEAEVYASDSFKYKLLLGAEDYRLIRSNPPSNSAHMEKKERMKLSIDKLLSMYKREAITIPPTEETLDVSDSKKINVSVGHINETLNLTYGERTGACMRIGGAGDSLFNFCLNNENGFHIKFTDPKDAKLISRVSGFRNGNTIFLNQLRSSLSDEYSNEDLVLALKGFVKIIMEKSNDSEFPIKNVVISRGYAMSNYISDSVTLGTDVKKGFDYFYSDVSSSNAIFLNEQPVTIETGPENSVKYSGLRQSINIVEDSIENISNVINRMHMINDLLNGVNIGDATLYFDSVQNKSEIKKIVFGEDWYFILDKDNNIIDKYMIEYNKKDIAEKEMEEEIKKYEDSKGKTL